MMMQFLWALSRLTNQNARNCQQARIVGRNNLVPSFSSLATTYSLRLETSHCIDLFCESLTSHQVASCSCSGRCLKCGHFSQLWYKKCGEREYRLLSFLFFKVRLLIDILHLLFAVVTNTKESGDTFTPSEQFPIVT